MPPPAASHGRHRSCLGHRTLQHLCSVLLPLFLPQPGIKACLWRQLGDTDQLAEQEIFENLVKEEYDEDVRRDILGMDNPHEALLRSKVLNEEGNKLFRSKAYWLAVNMYDKSLQYLFVLVLENADDANAIEELGISINLNLAASSVADNIEHRTSSE
ncbi:hypothetical protein Cgig2_022434 [Carnegiea gigantea]|uniref:Uncharacterized protein n=1 Tax=Carnegiea gigantea TaxID=171969 RepID=A0A9Q1JI07_9CARY|nr:hypothetical protein Cgig2_022434 [Carnegiea gigantea]